MYVSCHRHFFLVLLLNERWSAPLRLQASHCSTFRIMCDVPGIAVFCSESIECFPGIVSKFFFKLLVTNPVAPVITGTIVHFRFHIRCISIFAIISIIAIIIIAFIIIIIRYVCLLSQAFLPGIIIIIIISGFHGHLQKECYWDSGIRYKYLYQPAKHQSHLTRNTLNFCVHITAP